MSDVKQLEEVLQAICGNNNENRRQAEAFLDGARSQPDHLIRLLMQVACDSQNPTLRHLSCVLLRRNLSVGLDSLLSKLSQPVLHEVRNRFLSQLGKQDTKVMRMTWGGVLAGMVLDVKSDITGSWPELLPGLSGAVNSGNVQAQQVAFYVFQLIVPHFSTALYTQAMPILMDLLTKSLQCEQHVVRAAAAKCPMHIATLKPETDQLAPIRDLVPGVVQAVGYCIEKGDHQEAAEVLDAIATCAEVMPELFTNFAQQVVSHFFGLATANQLTDDLRRLAFELLQVLLENEPKVYRDIGGFAQNTFQLAFQLMMQVQNEQDAAWGTTPPDDDDECMDISIGVEACDRLSDALGPKRTMDVCGPLIMQMLQGEWYQRFAGYQALGQIGEVCSKRVKGSLNELMAAVMAGTEHPHERVRHAAVGTIARLCSDLGTSVQDGFHGVVLPRLVALMEDPCPKVVFYAVKCVTNYIAGLFDTSENLLPYLDRLLTALLATLQRSQHRFVSTAILGGISNLAKETEQDFTKYYDGIVPWLKSVIAADNVAGADRELRAKALDCLSTIIQAVGADKFRPDAPEILESLVKIQQRPMDAGDPQRSPLAVAWARVAGVMQDQFGPYAELVLPPVLQALAVSTDIQITDSEDKCDDDGVEEVNLGLFGITGRSLRINSAAVTDKTEAVHLLLVYWQNIPKQLVEHLQDIAPLLVPILGFTYSPKAREQTANMVPMIVKACRDHKPEFTQQFFGTVYEKLKECINLEHKDDVLEAQMDALAESIEAVPNMFENEQIANEILQLALGKFQPQMQELRKAEKRAAQQPDDDEEEDEDDEVEQAQSAICGIIRVLGALVRSVPLIRPTFLEKVFPQFAQMVQQKQTPFQVRLGLYILSDVLEAMGPGCPNLEAVLQSHASYMGASDTDLVQAAVQGIGTGFRCAPEQYGSSAENLLGQLVQLIRKNKDDEEWDYVVCTAVWSVWWAFKNYQGKVAACAPDAVLPMIFATMPLHGNDVEYKAVHDDMVNLVVTRHEWIMKQDPQSIKATLAKVKHAVSAEALPKLQQILA